MSLSINERISLLINELGYNNNSFAKSLDVSPTVTFNILSGRLTKPSFDLLQKILLTYDNVSAEWLLRGVGDIYINPDEKKRLQGSTRTRVVTPQTYQIDTKSQLEVIRVLKSQLDEANKLNNSLTEIILKLSCRSETP